MEFRSHCIRIMAAMAVMALVFVPAWAGVGTGTLTVDNDTSKCPGANGLDLFVGPNHWDVFQNDTIHINISPAFSICTTGVNLGDRCTTAAECSTTGSKCVGATGNKKCNTGPLAAQSCTTDAQCNVQGTCATALECSGDTTVIVKGHNGTVCTSDSDCSGPGETDCNTDIGFCKINDYISTSGRSGSGDIDVCYRTRSDMCLTATVAYCNDVGLLSNVNHPVASANYIAADLRTVDHTQFNVNPPRHDPIEECERETPTCANEVGSFCCSLSQGAYGAPKSIATAPCDANDENCGFIPASILNGCSPFSGHPNATLAGQHGVKSVQIGNLQTLIEYLPSGGEAGSFNSSVGADTHYDNTGDIPDQNPKKGNSKGQGAGVLAGQAMAGRMNSFMSACPLPFGGSDTFTASGFGGFVLPGQGTLLCTKRAGSDKILGSADDACQAFAFPDCAAGVSVDTLLAATNEHLAIGSNFLLCTAKELNVALDNANTQFNSCGLVIACPAELLGAGTFSCP